MTDIWRLGADADSLIALPDVVSISSPYVRVGGSQQSLEGANTMQTLAMKKNITITFDYMTDAEYDTLAQFLDGRQGNGPFVYQDPREDSPRTVNIDTLTDDSDLAGYRTSGGTGPQLVLIEV